MNKINDLPKDLPETTHEFQIDLVGRVTKRRFLGEFKCKIPTIKDQALISKHETNLNGENPIFLDAGIKRIHKMIAYLRFTLIDTPLFWRNADLGYDLRDDNVIEAVYDEVMAFENEWLKKVWGEGDKDESGSAEEKA
jgi:hypothetical protein